MRSQSDFIAVQKELNLIEFERTSLKTKQAKPFFGLTCSFAMVGRQGLEPWTLRLKVSCSAY